MRVSFIIFLLIPLFYFCQTNIGESLIVIHYDETHTSSLRQLIYKYNYINNVYSGREEIMYVDGKKNGKDYVRFDIGENMLYKNRYLISSIGNIIDLKEKKVLHDGTAKLISCSNDSIIFYTNDIFKGKFYSYYNLTTNSYSEIKSLTYKAILGQDVEFDKTTSPYKLEYFPRGLDKVLLMEDAGHGGVSASGKKTDIPLYWIDDNCFLFPNIKITDIEGVIVKYTLSTRTAKNIGNFHSISKLPATYILKKGKNTFIEFYFKEKLYLINPAKETMVTSPYKEIDSNFSVEVEQKENGRAVYFKGKEIGRNHFQIHNFKSSNTLAAIVKEVVVGSDSYQQGIAVFNISKAKWENIDSEDVAALVGWIK